jgi:predicted glycoside hydrolase/deacetylase ChbG (UPF0249 family)
MTTRIRLITRADDAGSNSSANYGTKECMEAGFLKNVSLMAVGSAIEEAADLFSSHKDICFGLHTCLNAEWDTVRWGSILPPKEVPSLLDSTGNFFATTRALHENRPNIDEVFRELNAQLERLQGLGFSIRYADMHMGWGWVVPNMGSLFAEWCAEKNILDYTPLHRDLRGFRLAEDPIPPLIQALEQAEAGQYAIVAHPAYDNEEMRALGHTGYEGTRVAWERERERRIYTDPRIREYCRTNGVTSIRYDEAERNCN